MTWPSGEDLLAAARDTLLAEVLDAVPSERRYAVLMIANAMAIAAREMAAGTDDLAVELDLFRRLYGDAAVAAGTADAARRRALDARLARDLRAGVLDGGAAPVRALLRHRVRARLRLSNPRYLAMAEGVDPAAGGGAAPS